MEHPPPRIRPMGADDCERVCALRVESWRHAYRGLMPQAHLDGLDAAADARRRRARFGRGDGLTGDLVAEVGGEVVGWAAYRPGRDDGADTGATGDAELYALYVDPAHLGTGVGRALLAESIGRCARWPRMRLWVVGGNLRARRFYERAGFRPDGAEQLFEVAGVPVTEVRYAREPTA